MIVKMAMKDIQLVFVRSYQHVPNTKSTLTLNVDAKKIIGSMVSDVLVSNVISSSNIMAVDQNANQCVEKNHQFVPLFVANQLAIALMDIFVILMENVFQKMNAIFLSRARIMRSKSIMFASVKVFLSYPIFQLFQ